MMHITYVVMPLEELLKKVMALDPTISIDCEMDRASINIAIYEVCNFSTEDFTAIEGVSLATGDEPPLKYTVYSVLKEALEYTEDDIPQAIRMLRVKDGVIFRQLTMVKLADGSIAWNL